MADVISDLAVMRTRVDRARDVMAEDLASIGSYLRCKKCGFARSLTREKAKRYLSSGWPLHCGATMELKR